MRLTLRLLISWLIVIAFTETCLAGEYLISEIADSLKKNAGAVVRINNQTITFNSIHGYLLHQETVISVLNQSQEDLAGVRIGYDEKRDNIKSFRAWIYNEEGKVIYQCDKHDGADYAATPGYILASSERVKYWNLNKLKPPYTIKYVYDEELKGTFQLPQWSPAENTGVSIEHAKLIVNCGPGMAINYKSNGITDSSLTIGNYSWAINGWLAAKTNPYGGPIHMLLPHVFLMARDFELYDFTGSARSWNDIGIFMNKLTEGRDQLNIANDPRLEAIIHSNIAQHEKIEQLYKFLQNNFRYVCITLGIGGWQPQEASFTLLNKYGDCKALSLVMKSMLKKAGIESNLVLVMAGDSPIDLTPEFPHSIFNHVILCVPQPNDTIWLECTSSNYPINYLGSFTSNRTALMIFNGGAQVVKTPTYTENDNYILSKADIRLNADNTSSATVAVTLNAEMQDGLRAIFSTKNAKDIESALYNYINLKNVSLQSYKLLMLDTASPSLSLALKLKSEGLVKKTESRLFVKTDLFSPIIGIPEKIECRLQKIYINKGYTQLDTLVYNLPIGFIPENFTLDDRKEFIDDFGFLQANIKYSAESGELKLIRKYTLKQGVYDAGKYQAFREFLLKATRQCCPDLVLKKKE